MPEHPPSDRPGPDDAPRVPPVRPGTAGQGSAAWGPAPEHDPTMRQAPLAATLRQDPPTEAAGRPEAITNAAEFEQRVTKTQALLEELVSLSGESSTEASTLRRGFEGVLRRIAQLDGPSLPEDQLGRLYSAYQFLVQSRLSAVVPPIPADQYDAAAAALARQLGDREVTPVSTDAYIHQGDTKFPQAAEVEWHGAPVGINTTSRPGDQHQQRRGRQWADLEAYQVDGTWFVSNGGPSVPIGDDGVFFGRMRPAKIPADRFVAIQPQPGQQAVSPHVSRLHGRIEVTQEGLLRVLDTSTNGTQVLEHYQTIEPADAHHAASTPIDVGGQAVGPEAAGEQLAPAHEINRSFGAVMANDHDTRAYRPTLRGVADAAEALVASSLGTGEVIQQYNQLGWIGALLQPRSRADQANHERIRAARQALWDATFTNPPRERIVNHVHHGPDASAGSPTPPVEVPIDWRGAPVGIGLMPNAVAAAKDNPAALLASPNYWAFAVDAPDGNRHWYVRARDGQGAAEITADGITIGRRRTPEHPELDVAADAFQRSADAGRGGEQVSKESLRLRRSHDGQLVVAYRSLNPAVVCEASFQTGY